MQGSPIVGQGHFWSLSSTGQSFICTKVTSYKIHNLGILGFYKMSIKPKPMFKSFICFFLFLFTDGWMSKYNVEHKYSSPWRVHESMKTVAYLPGALKTLEQQLAKSLGQFYDQFTVEEWYVSFLLSSWTWNHPCMHLMKISISSLNDVTVRPT